jgi:PAS domain S-box-containing protein
MIDEFPALENRFFDLSIDMLCIAGFDGYFKRLNRAGETTLGFTCAELQARPMFEFVHPDDLERTRDQNRRVRGGGRALSFENRYRCKDGSYRWLLWNSTADLTHAVIYAVARDITDRKQAEHERESLLQELQTAVAEVRTLRAILPMCSYCNRIRDDDDQWQSVDAYIVKHTNTKFSHGICPACYQKVVAPQLDRARR